MTPLEINARVTQALAASTRGWVPGGEGDPLALRKVHERFKEARFFPEPNSVTIEWTLEHVGGSCGSILPVWFITSGQPQRVFYDERTSLFGVAWGPDAQTSLYADLGFRTGDPIDAFLA